MAEVKTIETIAQENDIAPTQVSAFKKELEERMTEIFQRKNTAGKESATAKRRTVKLERKVGQLVIEKEFLEKKCEQLGVDLSERP